MKAHNVLDLVTELARAPEPQIRRNAATALAALSTDESVTMLVSMALGDGDQMVRERVEQELLVLGRKSESALATLSSEMNRSLQDMKTRLPAYQLFGRLYHQGLEIRLPGLSLRERIRFAISIRTSTGERAHYYRPLLMGTLVASACLILFSLLIAPHLDVIKLAFLLVCGSCLAPVAGFAAANRVWQWKPISLEFDRTAGLLVDSWVALIGGLLTTIVLLFVLLLSSLWTSGFAGSFAGWKLTFVPVFGGVLVFLGVRLVCGFTCGSFRMRGLDVVFTTLAGTAAGITIVVPLCFFPHLSSSEIASTECLLLIPISAGLAAAVSGVDHSVATPKRPVFGYMTSIAVSILLIGVVLSAILAAWPSMAMPVTNQSSNIQNNTETSPIGAGKTSIPLSLGVSTFREITVEPSTITGKITGDAASNFRLYWFSASGALLTVPPAGTFVWPSSPNRVSALAFGPPLKVDPGLVMQKAGQRILARLKRKAFGTPDAILEIDITPLNFTSIALPSSDPASLNSLCWQGTLRGYAASSLIPAACDAAVTKSNGDPEYRDSRGVNRALHKQFGPAIEDFTAYVEEYSDIQSFVTKVAERKDWIQQLKQKKNPFDQSLLQHLLTE